MISRIEAALESFTVVNRLTEKMRVQHSCLYEKVLLQVKSRSGTGAKDLNAEPPSIDIELQPNISDSKEPKHITFYPTTPQLSIVISRKKS